MTDVKTKSPVLSDPEIMGGVPCFAGTRVPVQSFFDAIKYGRSVDYFLSQFPSVTREQVEQLIDVANRLTLPTGNAA